ncbi:MAG: hypothetical protein J0M04_12800 [Verrucomicrobia bacterium]|nr:hypothetical protein [Verrucomicrobiota bacterium]
MKLTYSLLAAAFACGLASAQTTAYTTPVGYVTQTLGQNYNLIGLTVHQPTIAAGVIDAESTSSVTDNEVNFGTLLTAGASYVLELGDGTIQEITAWSGSVLTTPEDITANITPGTTTYKLRKASTISDVFGATNSAGLSPDTDGSLTGTDTVLVLNAAGNFETIYYFNDGAGTTGWFDDQGGEAANRRIIYADGFYVKRASATPLNLVISGEIKTTKTGGALVSGFNYVGSVAPVGLTLGTSGLEAYLAPDSDGSFTGTDLLYILQGGTLYTAYYFNDGAGTTGWFDDQGGDATNLKLEGGFLIKAASGPKPYVLNVPATYGSL